MKVKVRHRISIRRGYLFVAEEDKVNQAAGNMRVGGMTITKKERSRFGQIKKNASEVEII